MSKLGYTFYPKDWNTSEAVFELSLEERGFYRELIDLAMLNDNKTEIKLKVWARKFASEVRTLDSIIDVLETLKLVERRGENMLFIPSCEQRLKLSRAGRKGGEVSRKDKPTSKPNGKPNGKPSVSKPVSKPVSKRSLKLKEKESNIYRAFDHLKITEEEFKKLIETGYTKHQIDSVLDSIANYAKNKNYKSLHLTAAKWLKKEYPSINTPQSNLSLVELMKMK